MSIAALCHVMLEYMDDGKHESAFMKNLEQAGRCYLSFSFVCVARISL